MSWFTDFFQPKSKENSATLSSDFRTRNSDLTPCPGSPTFQPKSKENSATHCTNFHTRNADLKS